MTLRHDFAAFERCCDERPSNVGILTPAKDSARRDFGLRTDADIKNFIADGGLSDRQFMKRDPFRIGQEHGKNDLWTDVYDFWSGEKFGYFAFVQNPENGAWLVKSFKLNEKSDPRKLSIFNRENLTDPKKKGGTDNENK